MREEVYDISGMHCAACSASGSVCTPMPFGREM